MSVEISVQLSDTEGRGPDPAPHFARIRAAAEAALAEADVRAGFLSITLLDDGAMADLNARHLGHQGPTDVISFELDDPTGQLVGDVYLGYEVAARTAGEEDVPWPEELVRLTVHGVLHVLGHDHPDGPERTDSPMWRLQEALVVRTMADSA